MSDSDDDYEVGYGKPPKNTRFRKGQSGNPKGRPKRARGLKHDLQRELDETVTVTENGRQIRLSKQQLMVKQLFAKAMKGDIRAIQRIVELRISLIGEESDTTDGGRNLNADEGAILKAFIERNPRGDANG